MLVYKMHGYNQCMQYHRLLLEPAQTHDKRVEMSTQEQPIFVETKNWFDVVSNLTQQKFYHDEVESISKWQIGEEKYTGERNPSITTKDRLADSGNVGIDNKIAFKKFVQDNLHNPEFSNKYVIFAYGHFQDVGDDEFNLVDKIYKKFGNIDMYVGRVSQKIRIERIESSELC